MSLAGAALLATAAPLAAQGRGRGNGGVPPGHRPPPGMCRIWIDGVPPGQQPAPTDCASAVRNRPSNGRVIFGDDAGGRSSGRTGGWNKSRGGSRGVYDTDRDVDRGSNTTTNRPSGVWGKILGGTGATGATTCVDANRDGRCDDTRRSSTTCDDRNRDGYCDDVGGTSRGGTWLPEMISGVLIGRGQRTADVNRWLGGSQVTARPMDLDRNGVPARVMWYDRAGQLLQVWTDVDRDGRADRVERFQNGRRVQVIGE